MNLIIILDSLLQWHPIMMNLKMHVALCQCTDHLSQKVEITVQVLIV